MELVQWCNNCYLVCLEQHTVLIMACVLLLGDAPVSSARMMSLFQNQPSVHFALLSGPPNDIKGVWSKVCGDAVQWLPSDTALPQVRLNEFAQEQFFSPSFCVLLQGVEVVNLRLLKSASRTTHRVGIQ